MRLCDLFLRSRRFLSPGSAPALCSALLSGLLFLSSCSLQPRGSTVFIVEGKTEYDRAGLSYPESAEKREPIKLRWADTNTFLTTATLTPGKYLFSARTSDGLYYSQEMTVEPDVRRYTMPENVVGRATRVTEGPALSGTIAVDKGSKPTQLVVLFIGNDLTVRRVTSTDGKFTANAPAPGEYRVEVHGLGNPPKSFVRERISIPGRLDLGTIDLK